MWGGVMRFARTWASVRGRLALRFFDGIGGAWVLRERFFSALVPDDFFGFFSDFVAGVFLMPDDFFGFSDFLAVDTREAEQPANSTQWAKRSKAIMA